ncbi:MAG: transketolase [Elusimicrobia bacterium]|nr:transketolase [Candidatus Liberimonas magnetica]
MRRGGLVEISALEQYAKKIRRSIINMLLDAESGHPGGSLSAADIVTALYFNEMNFDPKNPKDPGRDFFILSKGHACPALYAVLAELGCVKSEELCTLRRLGSRLQGHPGSDKDIAGIEVSTGSLGYGLSIGVGTALASRIEKRQNRTYVLMGDGEQQEGSVWEAAMAAGHYKLDNLCAIVDNNRLQIDGNTKDIMNVEPLIDKYKSFGWSTIEINGHDFKEILDAFKKAKETRLKPSVIIARTVKGKGVSFMENICDWHGKAPTKELAQKALKELE